MLIPINVCVLGAGRGPLIGCTLRAVKSFNDASFLAYHTARANANDVAVGDLVLVDVMICGVEKNSNAYANLTSSCDYGSGSDQRRKKATRVELCVDDSNDDIVFPPGKVRLVRGDMRDSKTEEKIVSYFEELNRIGGGEYGSNSKSNYVDLVVSELLGSFGDNELSPECLDGMENGTTRLMRKGETVMIPNNYRTSLAPISSPTLHRNVLKESYLTAGDGGNASLSSFGACAGAHATGYTRSFETPYVVRSVHGSVLCADKDTGWEWKTVPDELPQLIYIFYVWVCGEQ